MDKNQAIEKINKLLRLANNSAATEGEKNNALEMAKRIAEKNGLKIVKGSNQDRPVYKNKFYHFHVNCYEKSLVEIIMKELGILWTYNKYNKEICFNTSRDFNEVEFKKFYKVAASVYNRVLKRSKEHGYGGRGSRKDFDNLFSAVFHDGFNGSGNNSTVSKLGELLKISKQNIIR